jgi:hypothetical protein
MAGCFERLSSSLIASLLTFVGIIDHVNAARTCRLLHFAAATTYSWCPKFDIAVEPHLSARIHIDPLVTGTTVVNVSALIHLGKLDPRQVRLRYSCSQQNIVALLTNMTQLESLIIDCFGGASWDQLSLHQIWDVFVNRKCVHGGKLRVLSLSGCAERDVPLMTDLINWIADNCPHLTSLDLSGARSLDTNAGHFATLARLPLTRLLLSNTYIRGHDPGASADAFPNLRYLGLNGSTVSWRFLQSFPGLDKIRSLHILRAYNAYDDIARLFRRLGALEHLSIGVITWCSRQDPEPPADMVVMSALTTLPRLSVLCMSLTTIASFNDAIDVFVGYLIGVRTLTNLHITTCSFIGETDYASAEARLSTALALAPAQVTVAPPRSRAYCSCCDKTNESHSMPLPHVKGVGM